MASPKDPLSSSDLLRSVFTSEVDGRIQHLSKLLSTSAGVDATLTLVGYGLALVSSQLSNLQSLELKGLSHLFASNASSTTLKAGSASILKLGDVSASLKVLAGMCSDFRTFTRLWGILGIYALSKKQYMDPPKDTVLKAVSLTQLLALGGYYVYENSYYLAAKGVLRGWTPEKIMRWAKTSLKLFLLYTVLDFVRLYRTKQLREERRAGLSSSDEKGKADIEKEDTAWWRSAVVSGAYAPLSVHWSSEKGTLSEGTVGALMTLVGMVKFKTMWQATA